MWLGPSRDAVPVVYRLVRCLFAELLVLRHENQVLRRQLTWAGA